MEYNVFILRKKEKIKMAYPSFLLNTGRTPVAGKDFNPDKEMCQDDYEYYTGTGRYTNNIDEVTPDEGDDVEDYDPREDYEPDDGFYWEMDGPEF
jgi:hypothetical protein